ncbi:MAG: hypothetical protein Q7S94_11125 [Gallionella sp.]|nr:hypothetical protein [Gallionella sp.]
MDLIAGISYIENSLAGRQPEHGEKKSARKNIRVETAEEQKEPAEVSHSATEYDSRLGRKLDTNA